MKNEDQVLSALLQVAISLIVAEEKLEFEHRDLHIGNVLVLEEDSDLECVFSPRVLLLCDVYPTVFHGHASHTLLPGWMLKYLSQILYVSAPNHFSACFANITRTKYCKRIRKTEIHLLEPHTLF